MRSPTLSLLVLGLLASGAAACHPRSLKEAYGGGVHVSTVEPMDEAATVTDRLECPATQGELTRTAQAPDGSSCDYSSDKGTVRLAYADGGADPKAALAPLRAQLDAELPGTAKSATIQVVSEKGSDGKKVAKVDMPFLHVEESGGRSHVKLLGMTIDSDKSTVHTNTDDDDDDADAKASATPAAQRGVKLVYVLVGKPAQPGGPVVAGYVAEGGATGRLVVGTFRYGKGAERFRGGDRNDHDLDELLRLNVKRG